MTLTAPPPPLVLLLLLISLSQPHVTAVTRVPKAREGEEKGGVGGGDDDDDDEPVRSGGCLWPRGWGCAQDEWR